jgi:arginine-tRNA-protein transferase
MQKYLQNGGKVSIKVQSPAESTPEMPTEFIKPQTSVPNISPLTDTKRWTANKGSNLVRASGLNAIIQRAESSNEHSAHRLKVKLQLAAFDQEMFELYKSYQMAIHSDQEADLTKEKFVDFLVDSPLGTKGPYGTYHQKYYLDDKLIAVGVLDILPKCVSSVYFIYDINYGKLSLGTYSALKEIDTVLDFQIDYPEIEYYYLGFIQFKKVTIYTLVQR